MQRLSCERYPCHFPEQDCTLCFCPFYPCKDERTGGREEGGEWTCCSCIIVHDPDVASRIMDRLMNGDDLLAAWKIVEEIL
jgi:threonine-phosphate decarboxylase